MVNGAAQSTRSEPGQTDLDCDAASRPSRRVSHQLDEVVVIEAGDECIQFLRNSLDDPRLAEICIANEHELGRCTLQDELVEEVDILGIRTRASAMARARISASGVALPSGSSDV